MALRSLDSIVLTKGLRHFGHSVNGVTTRYITHLPYLPILSYYNGFQISSSWIVVSSA